VEWETLFFFSRHSFSLADGTEPVDEGRAIGKINNNYLQGERNSVLCDGRV
jgi:hypothetical protein